MTRLSTWGRIVGDNGLKCGWESGTGSWRGFRRGGSAEVADDAGGGPGLGEGGAGFGFGEAEDEAVHLFEKLADFPELGPEGEGERATAGNRSGGLGGGRSCPESPSRPFSSYQSARAWPISWARCVSTNLDARQYSKEPSGIFFSTRYEADLINCFYLPLLRDHADFVLFVAGWQAGNAKPQRGGCGVFAPSWGSAFPGPGWPEWR